MTKPWEKYGSTKKSGPWEKFRKNELTPKDIAVEDSTSAGLLQGALMNSGDEALAAIKALGDVSGEKYKISDIVDRYRQRRSEYRKFFEKAQKDNPIAFGGAQFAGGLATGLATGGAGTAATLAKQGIAYGLGSTEDDFTKGEIGPETLLQVGGNAALAPLAGKGIPVVASKAKDLLETGAGKVAQMIFPKVGAAKAVIETIGKPAASKLKDVVDQKVAKELAHLPKELAKGKVGYLSSEVSQGALAPQSPWIGMSNNLIPESLINLEQIFRRQ